MHLVFGGTFDPVHLGHTHLARTVLAHYQAEKLLFIPAYQNPHKAEPFATPEQRIKMLELACNDFEPELRNKIDIIDWEARSAKPSYTFPTVLQLLETGYSDLALIMGNDVYDGLFDWYEAKKLVQTVNLIIVTRDESAIQTPEVVLDQLGCEDIEVADHGTRIYHSKGRRWVDIFHFSALPFASSEVRCAIADAWKENKLNTPLQSLAPQVFSFIKENGLYNRIGL